MSEDVDKLRETLATLHAELGSIETRDPEVRDLLAGTLKEIADKLSARAAGVPLEAPVSPELAEAARQFEVEHPTLAATLRGVVESLSRMGI